MGVCHCHVQMAGLVWSGHAELQTAKTMYLLRCLGIGRLHPSVSRHKQHGSKLNLLVRIKCMQHWHIYRK